MALSRLYRLTTWLLAATVVIGSLGIPMSVQRGSRSGEAFPCQDCACGCSTAEACWRNCCCFTNAQKVVWAVQNGVKVPVYVMAAARREQAQAESHAASSSCATKSCCSTGASCCDEKGSPAPASEQDRAGKAVLLISALKCRGISLSVGFLPPAIPARPIAWDLSRPEPAWRRSNEASLYRSPVFDVATPPPDAAV